MGDVEEGGGGDGREGEGGGREEEYNIVYMFTYFVFRGIHLSELNEKVFFMFGYTQ